MWLLWRLFVDDHHPTTHQSNIGVTPANLRKFHVCRIIHPYTLVQKEHFRSHHVILNASYVSGSCSNFGHKQRDIAYGLVAQRTWPSSTQVSTWYLGIKGPTLAVHTQAKSGPNLAALAQASLGLYMWLFVIPFGYHTYG